MDFKQYYASSKLILSGKNPYDHTSVWEIQRTLGLTIQEHTQVTYSPPTSLLPFIPLGWLNFETAIQIHLIMNVILLVLSGFFCSQALFPEHPALIWVSAAAIVAWLPDILLCGIGQNSAWTLFGFTGWMLSRQRNQPVLAGILLALTIMKPHLALLPVLYAILTSWKQSRFVVSFAAALLVMIAASLIIRPTIWNDYLASLPTSNPTQWYNATLDGWGRLHLGSWFRAISLMSGAALALWVFMLGWRQPAHPRTAVLVLIISLCAIPYSFSYDFALLVPAFILSAGSLFLGVPRQRWWVFAGWILLDVFYYVLKSHTRHESNFFVIPWGALALTLWLLSGDSRTSDQSTQESP